MEVHHHSHTPRTKWGHYFWEFFMLFLAVTLGFVVENWREHNLERSRAKEYAKLLKIDLVNDTTALNEVENTLAAESSRSEYVSQLLRKEIQKITIGELRKRDSTSLSINMFLPNNATYEQMKSSGELRYFTDIGLINKLAVYYWQIKHFDEMMKILDSEYGGISNQRYMDYEIKKDDFLKVSQGMDSSLPAMKAGYKFDYWFESKKIIEDFLIKNDFKKEFYPQFKAVAIEIINILDKKYHLK